MGVLKLHHVQCQSDSWKRLLGFMIEENIHQKKILSSLLKYRLDHETLEQVEEYHTRFIKEDQLIAILRNDLSELDVLLSRELFDDGRSRNMLEKKIKKLKADIESAETAFAKLKSEFNSYLLENI